MPRIRADGGLIGRVNDPTASVASGMWSLKAAEKANRSALWPAATYTGALDSYFNLTQLLLHGDGTNGANNTVFADSSTNAYTVTTSGKPTQGTFSPFSPTGWSNYFNGSSDYLSGTTSALAIGTNSFTVEFFAYKLNAWSTGDQYIIDNGISGGLQVWVSNANATLRLGRYGTDFQLDYAYSNLAINTWYHFAYVRSGTSMALFVNGIRVATATSSVSYASAGTQNIGRSTNGTGFWNGYISNLRVVNGTAVYDPAQTTITVPTTSLTAVTNTSLLICQSNRFVDNSTNAFTLTPAGTPSVQAFSPFAPTSAYAAATHGGSAYFNGSTDYLTLPNNMTVIGTNAYTLEGWFYPTTVSAAEIPLVKLYNATQTVDLRIVSSKIQGRINNSATIVGGNTTLYPNQWYHFALVKPTSGTSTAVLYLNGVAEATTASDTTTYTAFTTPRIGANQTPNLYLTGWASNVRVLNGTAQYTGNFTLPTVPFTNITNTLALLNFTNAGIIDNTSRNTFNTYGAAAISTTQSKFGGSSMYFDGSSYVATGSPGVQYQFGTGNWTIEMWAYPTSTGATQTLYQIYGTTNDNINIQFNGSTLAFFVDIRATNQTATTATSSVTATLNAWNHIAVVRDSATTIKLYVNGSLGATATIASTTTFVDTQFASNPTIGAKTNTVGNYFTGYIDDLRITKYARYSSNFDPTYFAAFLDQ